MRNNENTTSISELNFLVTEDYFLSIRKKRISEIYFCDDSLPTNLKFKSLKSKSHIISIFFRISKSLQHLTFIILISNDQSNLVWDHCRIKNHTNIQWLRRKISKRHCYLIWENHLSFLTYSLIIVWGDTYATTLNAVVVLQKKAVQIITYSNRDAHSSPLLSQLGLIKLMDLVTIHTAPFLCFNSITIYYLTLLTTSFYLHRLSMGIVLCWHQSQLIILIRSELTRPP